MCDRIAGPFRAFGIAKAFARIVGAFDWWVHSQVFIAPNRTSVDTYWVAYELPKLLNPPESL